MQSISIIDRKGMRRAFRYINKVITDDNKESLRRRDILDFKNKYGVSAATEAFKISRSTLLSWQKEYKSNGMCGLLPLSPKPYI
jgi:hypothetical protein